MVDVGKPVICMVADHACIRVFKEGVALMKKGYRVHLVARKQSFGWNAFTTFSLYSEDKSLTATIKQLSDTVDIFHVHNEPDWLVRSTREGTDKPIIFDVHDLECMRLCGEPDQDEIDAFEMSNGLVHVSQPCKDHADIYHKEDKPYTILPPYVNREFIPEHVGQPSPQSIVYEGGVTSDTMFERLENGKSLIGWRYYIPMVFKFREAGFNVGLFGANTEADANKYYDAGGVIISQVPYPYLLRAIRPYGLGFVGAVETIPLMEAAMPNKLMEYITQGIVPVIYNCGESARFCEYFDCGIKIDTLENIDIPEELVWEKRKNVMAIRKHLAMEDHIYQVEELYQEVL